VRGYTEVYERVDLALDSRRARPAPGHGVRLELAAENGSDLRGSSGWVRYGGTVGGFVDLTGTQRVLSLSFAAFFADPLGKNAIPFTELVSLGGDQPMRGFFPGRLIGRSAAVLTARYRWPIWMWLDGSLVASVGNVFDEHLSGFQAGLLRFSGAIGLDTTFSTTSSIEVLVGFGTETFDNHATVNEARFAIGTSRGF
jgi:outer membrane protein assembly factor BamA